MRSKDIRSILSNEERAKYDTLIFEASFDSTGRRRPSYEIGDRIHAMLLDAVQAQEPWAQWVLDADARAGHIRRFKRWDRIRNLVRTKDGGQVVRLSGIQAVKRRDPVTQTMFWADTELEAMSRADLDAVIGGMRNRIEPLEKNIRLAKKLHGLCVEQNAVTVGAALKSLGKTLDEFLEGGEIAA